MGHPTLERTRWVFGLPSTVQGAGHTNYDNDDYYDFYYFCYCYCLLPATTTVPATLGEVCWLARMSCWSVSRFFNDPR